MADWFGEIPHAELPKRFTRHISDGRMHRLIKAWLEIPVEEDDGKGSKRRKKRKGTPKGSPISLYCRKVPISADVACKISGACEAQAARDPRHSRLRSGRGGFAADQSDVRHREGDPRRTLRGAPGRSPGTDRAAGRGVRALVEAVTYRSLTEVALGREAGQHRQSLEGPAGVPPGRSRGDGLRRRGEHDQAAGLESLECAVRRP